MRRRATAGLLFPAAVYLVVLHVLQPHLLAHVSSHFFFGGPDGYQNAWNLWWVDRAITQHLTSPWFTPCLHHPFGATLVGHTLNPFNGFAAVPLLRHLTLVQAYNAIVIFSFVMGGVTMFWLCREVTKSYVGSLAGGGIFTFSSFHFMHADSHLQLVALQWIPLFVLHWMRYCREPTAPRGVLAAGTLLLVALCDLYYFAYCVMAGALFALWTGRQRGDYLYLLKAPARAALAGFLVPASLTSGALVAALVRQHATDPLFGTHPPRELSMDLLSPFVWGRYSRYHEWTEPAWRQLSGYPAEASVYLGISVVALAVYGWRSRRRSPMAHAGYWAVMGLFFFVMSLGPNLHIGGWELGPGFRITFMGRDDVNPIALPYAWLWVAFPPWRLAGVPLRMMVMVQLVAAIMAAAGIRALAGSTLRWKRTAIAAVLAILALDYLPAPQAVTAPSVPDYVHVLRALPAGAVLDLASAAPQALYYQTLHGKPMAFGYIARTPTSLVEANEALVDLILAGQWERLAREYRFRYVVTGPRPVNVLIRRLDGVSLPVVDRGTRIYTGDGVTIHEF